MLHSLASLGDVGYVDLQQISRQLKAISPVSLDAARSILAQGQNAIDRARNEADSSPLAAGALGSTIPVFGPLINLFEGAQAANQPDVPGKAQRDNVADHLRWHRDHINESTDAQPYDAADDLKDWVQRAMVEYNAVQAVDEQVAANRAQFFSDVSDNLRKIPRYLGQLAKVPLELAGEGLWEILKAFFTSPLGLLLLAGGGYYAYTKFFRKGGE